MILGLYRVNVTEESLKLSPEERAAVDLRLATQASLPSRKGYCGYLTCLALERESIGITEG